MAAPEDDDLDALDGACDTRLKFFDAAERFSFGQWIDLTVTAEAGNTPGIISIDLDAAAGAPAANRVAVRAPTQALARPRALLTGIGGAPPAAAAAPEPDAEVVVEADAKNG
jgi:hypothetical protein